MPTRNRSHGEFIRKPRERGPQEETLQGKMKKLRRRRLSKVANLGRALKCLSSENRPKERKNCFEQPHLRGGEGLKDRARGLR